MSVINTENAGAWKDLAEQLSGQRPSPGRLVRVTHGKRKGVEGLVLVHQRSRYSDAFRYGGEANLHLRDMAGRSGFCVKVQDANTPAQFWVDANKVEVIERFTETDPDYI